MSFDVLWHRTLRRPFRLHTEFYGDPNKPTVVLLHGIAASGFVWNELIPLLTPYYQCITIDLLGFGQSPKPQWADYSIDQHVQAIGHTIHSLHLRGGYVLAGHSLGSLLATNYARRHPTNIQRLLLLSPPVYPPLNTIEGRLALKRTDLLMRVYQLLRKSPRMTPANLARLSRLGIVPRSVITNPDTWIPFERSLERCIEQQTIEEDIQRIRFPIDIFYGMLDTVVVGENVRAIARLSDVQLHRFKGNHALGRTYAKTIARTLLAESGKLRKPAGERRP